MFHYKIMPRCVATLGNIAVKFLENNLWHNLVSSCVNLHKNWFVWDKVIGLNFSYIAGEFFFLQGAMAEMKTIRKKSRNYTGQEKERLLDLLEKYQHILYGSFNHNTKGIWNKSITQSKNYLLCHSQILRENHHASVVRNWYHWVAIAY